jgi:hypothetical protein
MIITDKKFSDVIQSFIANEINAILVKYNSIESDTFEKVENLISQIDDEELREEFLSDFNKTSQLATEIGDKYVDNLSIKLFMWMKSNTDLNLNIGAVENLIEEVEEKGYCEINNNTMIYIEGTNLKNIAVEKLETMLENSYFVDKFLDKDSLIEYFINGTSKDEVIRELVTGIEIEELLDMNIQTIFDNNYNQRYMFAELEC